MLLIVAAVAASLFLFGSRAYAYSSVGAVKCRGYLNIRKASSTRSKIMGRLYPGTKVSITSTANGWYRISCGRTNGWVSAKYISKSAPAKSASVSSRSVGSSIISTGLKIADYANKYVGVKYIYGGSMPSGFDCSGLTSYVYSRFGVGLSRRASAQARQGVTVSRSALRPGDLVFFDTNGGHNDVSHVGIYIGNNRFVHAATGSAYRVIVSSLNENYYRTRFMTAKRIV